MYFVVKIQYLENKAYLQEQLKIIGNLEIKRKEFY
jgi:hypothetical protein